MRACVAADQKNKLDTNVTKRMGHHRSDIPSELAESYMSSTEKSKHLHEIATGHLPGGNTRTTLHFDPYPIYIKKGHGCRVTDVDGNQYIDFFNNATSLVHGHSNNEINEAAKQAISSGSAPGGPTRSEIELASHLTDRIASMDEVRFTNSGTEATLQAVRAARAYTGNNRIAKFEGIYHGTHDQAQISISPSAHLAGPPDDPNSIPDSDGIHPSIVEDTVTLPYNSTDAAKKKLNQYANDLAGVLIHPLMGTKIIPAKEVLIKV
jgi:glutamate-1-semialdehyde 2,1-aminomutase